MSVLPREFPYSIASEKITQAFLGKPASSVGESILACGNACSFAPVIDKYSITEILAYMSPEQVECNSSEVDTRTDAYALGVKRPSFLFLVF